MKHELHDKKMGLWGCRSGLTQLVLKKTRNFGYKKKRDCTFHEVKTKMLMGCAVTAQLIGVFDFAYAKIWFSHGMADIEVK